MSGQSLIYDWANIDLALMNTQSPLLPRSRGRSIGQVNIALGKVDSVLLVLPPLFAVSTVCRVSRLSRGFKLKPSCFPTPVLRYDLYRTHPSVLRESISDVEVLGNDVNVIHRLTRSRFLENISGWPSGVLISRKLGCPCF